ncbi:Glyoxalase/bleomycin resistance protein/dioxygenase [Actinobacteria bacterium OK006]|nr:Glyoxalase/bleomycin resistance protein/dioxygenase [Actinobacteria bacterium OK006]
MDHLGVEAESTEAVHAATTRLADQCLTTDVENDTTCCYPVQDKV